MDINNKILEKLNEARKVALDELIAQALKILNQYKEDYEECVIAMGSLFFTTTSNTRKDGSLTFSDGDLTHEYFKPLVDIIEEWDDLLKLTGEGVRFKADGILKYNW
jgi:hypothetical protein